MTERQPVRLWLSALVERLRASLFVVPMVAVFFAIGAGLATITVDSMVEEPAESLPLVVVSTVESARAVLSTVASATIAFAGVAFSITLLTIQRASNQYSPRVVHTVFRDPFNRRIMALVVGTFTYCVIVLRSVRSALEAGGEAVVPNLSVAVAVVAGIATILGIVAFINHNAHAMNIGEILDRVRHDAVAQARRAWPPAERDETGGDGDRDDAVDAVAGDMPEDVPPPEVPVRFELSGWVQQVDEEALFACLPDGHALRVETYPGHHAIAGAVLGTIPRSLAGRDGIEDQVRGSIVIGNSRTLQQDVAYGLRQLADVALRALSPSINDPATAQDAMYHAAAVLAELLHREAPAEVRHGPRDTWLLMPGRPTHAELVDLTFDEVRRAGADQPSVCVHLLEVLSILHESTASLGLTDRCPPLVAQADLVLAGAEAAGLLPHDLWTVRRAHAERFGGTTVPAGTDGRRPPEVPTVRDRPGGP